MVRLGRSLGSVVLGLSLRLAVLSACAAPAAAPGAAPPPAAGGAPAAASPETAPALPPGAAVPPKPGPLRRIELGVVALAAYFYPMWIGVDKGFYAQQGLNVELTTLQTNEAVAALVSGSLDILHCPTDSCITALSKGAQIRMVNDYTSQAPYDLIARPELTSIADLRGKKVGVSSLSAGTGSLAKVMLRAQGFGPDDYQLVQAGGNPARYTALQSGGIDAALLSDPVNFTAMQDGYRVLLSFSDIVPLYSFVSHWVTNSWLEDPANREALVSFQAGQINAQRWAHDPANKDAVIDVLVRYARTTPTIAERIYEFYMVRHPGLVDVSDLREGPVQAVISILRDMEGLGPLPPEDQWLDRSFIQRARQLAGLQPS